MDRVFEEALKRLAYFVKSYSDPEEKTQQFVRDVHRQWKENGGKLSGKIRHSDRFLEDQLRELKTPIKSLVPKLSGKTNIAPADAEVLLRYFFTNWPHDVDGDVEYKSIISENDITAICDFVEAHIRERVLERGYSSVRVLDEEIEEPLPGRPAGEVVIRYFRECDAYITISPVHIFVSAGPNTELIGFRDLVDAWRENEGKDKKKLLIWILDLGGPKLSDLSTRKKYFNVQQLYTRFKVLEHFKDDHAEERLKWLKERVAIVILDTYGDWRQARPLNRLPNFSSHHATVTNINPDWAASPSFRALYGTDLERIDERVFTIFFNAARNWPSDPQVEQDLRYFAFATFKKNPTEGITMGLELPALPERYAEALRTVCAGCSQHLGLKLPHSQDTEVSGATALQQLEHLGLRVLKLDEFMEWY
jgi:hypothetical protein